MAYEHAPGDPSRPDPTDGAYRAQRAADELRNAARLDNELQMDPELSEGPVSGGKVAALAIAVALILGAVFYGLNHTTVNPQGTSTAQNTPSTPPAAPPGMRDVTPRGNNTAPGMTTGAAPAQPQRPDMNRTGNPPLDSGQSK